MHWEQVMSAGRITVEFQYPLEKHVELEVNVVLPVPGGDEPLCPHPVLQLHVQHMSTNISVSLHIL